MNFHLINKNWLITIRCGWHIKSNEIWIEHRKKRKPRYRNCCLDKPRLEFSLCPNSLSNYFFHFQTFFRSRCPQKKNRTFSRSSRIDTTSLARFARERQSCIRKGDVASDTVTHGTSVYSGLSWMSHVKDASLVIWRSCMTTVSGSSAPPPGCSGKASQNVATVGRSQMSRVNTDYLTRRWNDGFIGTPQ